MLSKENPSWKLPERRVNKFLKRYQNKNKNVAGADDDATEIGDSTKSGSSNRSGFGKLSKLFGRSKSSKKVVLSETAPPPVTEIKEPVKPVPKPEPVPEPEPIAEEEPPEPVVEEKALPDVYEDDNKSDDNQKCECNACCIM